MDNGSKRGRERLNILTRSLLLRRCKDQMDSTGKPLVGLDGCGGLLLKEQHAEDTVTFSILALFTLAEVNICVFQVSLPNRSCQVHQLKLSQDEQAVYDVVFAQSR